ncbi:UDP-N-acetylglucosamine 2-epimerase, partial [gut metagenome]
SCQQYANRVIRMGEDPSTVFNVGGLGDENLRTMPKMTAQELAKSLNFDVTKPFGLVTFHPETAGEAEPISQMDALLWAMETVSEQTGLRWLITKSNADAGGLDINQRIDDWTKQHRRYAAAFTSLGVVRYLSAMNLAALVAGNSSSGMVETPTMGVPTVNIGD